MRERSPAPLSRVLRHECRDRLAQVLRVVARFGQHQQRHGAGSQYARTCFRLFLFAAIHPELGQIFEDFVRRDSCRHYGFLQTWPRRASMASDAAGPHVPAG